MSWNRWLDSLAKVLGRTLRRAASRRRVSRLRLGVEQLEDRTVPTVIDLTTLGASGTVNGAIVFQASPASGTGLIDPFLRIQASADKPSSNEGDR